MIFLRLSRREREVGMTGSTEGGNLNPVPRLKLGSEGVGDQDHQTPSLHVNFAMMSSFLIPQVVTNAVDFSPRPPMCRPRIWELVEYSPGKKVQSGLFWRRGMRLIR